MDAKTEIRSVLLMGTESVLALPAIRALNKAFPGADIHALSPRKEKIKVAEGSWFVSGRHVFESELSDPENLIRELEKIVSDTAAQVILPIGEIYVEFLAEHQTRIREFAFLPPVTRSEELRKLTFKSLLSGTLKDCGLPHAMAKKIEAVTGVERDWHYFPCILKPVHGDSGDGVSLVHNHEEVDIRINEGIRSFYVRHEEGYVLEEFIPGYNIDCSLIAVNGELKVLTMQKGIVDRGLTYANSIKLLHSEKIREYIERLLKHTGFSGVGHADFRLDERDGELRLIDFNARVWSSLLGSEAVGVNFMEYLVMTALNIPFKEPQYEDGIYHMGMSAVRAAIKHVIGGDEYKDLPAYFDIDFRFKDPVPQILSAWYRVMGRWIDYSPG